MRTHKIIARRRGISLAEVAVALAVIMIISAATATFLVRAVDTETEVANTITRNEQVENVLECYQWANGEAAVFKNALLLVGYEQYGTDELRFTLDYIDVALTIDIDSNDLTGITISGPNLDEVINYG